MKENQRKRYTLILIANVTQLKSIFNVANSVRDKITTKSKTNEMTASCATSCKSKRGKSVPLKEFTPKRRLNWIHSQFAIFFGVGEMTFFYRFIFFWIEIKTVLFLKLIFNVLNLMIVKWSKCFKKKKGTVLFNLMTVRIRNPHQTNSIELLCGAIICFVSSSVNLV